MSTNKANQAFLSRIAKAALAEFSRDDLKDELYVAQLPAGMGFSDASLEVLQQLELDRLSDPALVARLIDLSRMVDCIQIHPGRITTPANSPIYLSDVFPRLIENVEFLSAPMSDAARRKYEQAKAILYEEYPYLKTPTYDEFCILRSDVEKKDVKLLEMQRNLQSLTDSEERTALSEELAAFQELVTQQKEVLEALDRTYSFRIAEADCESATRKVDEVPEPIRNMLANMLPFKIGDPISGDEHVGCNFFPPHLGEDNWAPLRLTQDDIASKGQNDAGTENQADGLDESLIDSIELEVQTVVCDRSWFWSPLFHNKQWKWSSTSPPISRGTGDNSEGDLIPAYIYGLIFGRKLIVKGRSSKQKTLKPAIVLQPNSNLLMRSLVPLQPTAKASPTAPAPKTTLPVASVKPNLRINTAVASGRIAPVVSRNTVKPALAPQPRTANKNLTIAVKPTAATAQSFKVAQPKIATTVRPATSKSTQAYKQLSTLQPNYWIAHLGITVQGRVIDEQGRGIYQATVTLKGRTGQRRVMTGQNGTFSIALAQGRYQVQVNKAGFVTTNGAITVPRTGAYPPIRMKKANSCIVNVRLLENANGQVQPFTGAAKITIKGVNFHRIEAIEGQSNARLFLPSGVFTIAVVIPEAEKITPPSPTCRYQTRQTLAHSDVYELSRALVEQPGCTAVRVHLPQGTSLPSKIKIVLLQLHPFGPDRRIYIDCGKKVRSLWALWPKEDAGSNLAECVPLPRGHWPDLAEGLNGIIQLTRSPHLNHLE